MLQWLQHRLLMGMSVGHVRIDPVDKSDILCPLSPTASNKYYFLMYVQRIRGICIAWHTMVWPLLWDHKRMYIRWYVFFLTCLQDSTALSPRSRHTAFSYLLTVLTSTFQCRYPSLFNQITLRGVNPSVQMCRNAIDYQTLCFLPRRISIVMRKKYLLITGRMVAHSIHWDRWYPSQSLQRMGESMVRLGDSAGLPHKHFNRSSSPAKALNTSLQGVTTKQSNAVECGRRLETRDRNFPTQCIFPHR